MMVATAELTSLSTWRDDAAKKLASISDAPLRECEWLIEHVTGFSRTQQRLHATQMLNELQLQQLNELCTRRITGEPLAYVLEEAHFWTLRLRVSPAVLIPRPETELVVERALHHLAHPTMTVLDLGTGSGAIALAIAKERPDCNIVACDVSTDALGIAQYNKNKLQLSNVELITSNWFSALAERRFDVIVANPPYIGINDPDVQADVRVYEPHLALFADDNGLAAMCSIISQARRHLHQGGWLILEHGWQQAADVQELLESQGLNSVASHTDLAGHQRVTEAKFSST